MATRGGAGLDAADDAITGRGSHDKTLANIREAVRRDIRLPVAVISMTESQDVNGAVTHLRHLGVFRASLPAQW